MPFSETFVSARPGTVGLPKSGCLVGADGAFMVWVSENLYWQFMLLSGCAKCTSAGAHSKLTFRLARSSSRSGHGPLKTGARGDTHTGPVTLNPRWLRIQRAERGSHPIANTVNSIARKKGRNSGSKGQWLFLCAREGGSDEIGLDGDIAVRGLGVRANPVRSMDQLLRDLAVEARQTDVEARRQEEGAVGEVQVDLGVDRYIARERDLLFGGSELDRADVAGRPSDAEEILGRRMRLRWVSSIPIDRLP